MDHVADAELLHLWSTWSRQDRGGPAPATCRSAESRYVAEAGEVFSDHDRDVPAPIVPDHVGQRVERAVLATGRPYCTVPVDYYVRRLPVAVISRRLHVGDARQVLDQAHRRIAAQLG